MARPIEEDVWLEVHGENNRCPPLERYVRPGSGNDRARPNMHAEVESRFPDGGYLQNRRHKMEERLYLHGLSNGMQIDRTHGR